MRRLVVLLSLLITLSPALAEDSPDFTGAWKRDCTKNYGLKIWRNDDDQFSVAFCGPVGCGSPAWTPHTPTRATRNSRSCPSPTSACGVSTSPTPG